MSGFDSLHRHQDRHRHTEQQLSDDEARQNRQKPTAPDTAKATLGQRLTLRTWAEAALIGIGLAGYTWLFCGLPGWLALVTAVGLMAVYVWRRKISER